METMEAMIMNICKGDNVVHITQGAESTTLDSPEISLEIGEICQFYGF
jgi:hypothetical protein